MKIQIGKHEIGDSCPPFIIAEVGSNWRTFDDCKHSIQMAKQVGADAVKFQAFDELALYGVRSLTDATNPRTCTLSDAELEARGSLRKTLPGQLPLDWLPKLKEKADVCGIEFMCSAFSPELVRAVDPYVNIHKVASAELTHVRMLETLRELGKPVILSTGASGVADIKQALALLENMNYFVGSVYAHRPTTKEEWENANPIERWTQKPCDVILMYCVAAYPAKEIALETIKGLKDQFNTLVGYSDHSCDVLHIPVHAVRESGGCVLEKHFTAIDADTPDRPHSLTVDQFKRMVSSIRESRTRAIGPTPEEKPMILRHNRRLLAITDIAVGDTLEEGKNFGIYRSLKDETHAFSPWMINEVSGKTALRAIKLGDGVGPGDCVN